MRAKDFLRNQAIAGGSGGGGGEDENFAKMIDGTLEEATIPTSVTAIRTNAFDHHSGLKKVVGHSGITSMGNYAFQNCTKLEVADFSKSKFKTTGSYTFKTCSKLKTIKLPETLTEVGFQCFSSDPVLEEIELPSEILSFSGYAFSNCYALKKITIKNGSQVVTLDNNALYGVPEDCIIKVPAGMVDTYKAASAWSSRADYIQAIE